MSQAEKIAWRQNWIHIYCSIQEPHEEAKLQHYFMIVTEQESI